MAWTHAQETFFAASRRNPQRSGKLELNVPEKVLEPDETVLEFLRCSLKGDSFPLLIVTDRRVLYAVDNMFTRWTVREQIPSAEVAGAELESRRLSGRVHVRRGDGSALTVRVSHPAWSEHVVGLINHLAGGGAPPAV